MDMTSQPKEIDVKKGSEEVHRGDTKCIEAIFSPGSPQAGNY